MIKFYTRINKNEIHCRNKIKLDLIKNKLNNTMLNLKNLFCKKYSYSFIFKNNLLNNQNHLIHKIKSQFSTFKMEDTLIAKMKNIGKINNLLNLN